MSDRAVVVASRVAVAIGVLLAIPASAVFASIDVGLLLSEGGTFAVFSVFFAIVVWLVIPRQPGNVVVRLMAATGLAGGVYIAAWAGAAWLVADPASILGRSYVPADLPSAAAWIIAAALPISTGVLIAQLTYGLLLFPDGRLPAPRWRWVGALIAVGIALETLGLAWDLRPWSSSPTAQGLLLTDIGDAIVAVAALLSLVALALRFRRADGAARQQFKWILWGAAILSVSLVAVIAAQGEAYEELLLAVFAVASGVFVVSYGIAIGKYRLYDIDVVISRTFVYGSLALFITGVYVAAVVGLGGLLGADPQSSPLLSIGATALVAFAFEPLRERLHRLANRLVYGQRATPYEVLSDFAGTITASDEELLDQVARSLAEGTSAASAAVWVRRNGSLDRVAAWPDGTGAEPDGPRPEDQPTEPGDLRRPVVHDGETLGALTLTAARGQALLATDEQLLEQMAAGMGLALRNIRLGEDLRGRVDQLRRSRRRLVTVQDETRRHLERQLHDGAQQRLVALKVKLALAKRKAEASGSDEVAGLLDHVAGETDQAIAALRDFARGVYPPLLEAEGPGAALSSQVRKLPIEVTVHSRGVSRYPRPVEAAIYFCVLEALQNVAKHSGASSAHVAIRESDGALEFEVSDDGAGFDPSAVERGSGLANLADRLDALDGTFEVTSSPGRGTTVQGTIPSPSVEMVP